MDLAIILTADGSNGFDDYNEDGGVTVFEFLGIYPRSGLGGLCNYLAQV